MASRGMRWFGREGRCRKVPARRWQALEILETRDLMYADCLVGELAPHDGHEDHLAAAIAPATIHHVGELSSSAGLGDRLTPRIDSIDIKPVQPLPDDPILDAQMGTPVLDSNPGAPVTIYLDFNGHVEQDWWYRDDTGYQVHYYNVVTPAFDQNNDTTSFDSAEQSLIRQIWARVAEDYAPFNVNVSTDYYGTFDNGKAVRVAIGGSNQDWLGADSSGIASIGSFLNDTPNTVYVFDLMDWAAAGVTDQEGRPLDGATAIATTASHEAGHAFGLRHQSKYYNTTLVNNYNPGTSEWTPIMGNNLANDRTKWHYGPNDLGSTNLQNDIDRLRSLLQYRPDDHANSTGFASPMLTNTLTGAQSASGLIHYMGDSDFFKFTTTAGTFRITVNAAQYGPNLVPVGELWSSAGRIMGANAGDSTRSIIDASLTAGNYYVMVRSSGVYGDLGQYSVSVSFRPTKIQISTTQLSTASTSTFSSTYQEPLLVESTSKGSAGAGQGTMPMVDAPTDLSIGKHKGISRAGLHDELFALESFVDELGGVAGLKTIKA